MPAVPKANPGVDALMHEFSLSSEEGVALMCLAEALLRIPDNATRDRLIADKISEGNWKSHLNNSPSSSLTRPHGVCWITGKLTATNDKQMSSALSRLISKGGAPLIPSRCELRHAPVGLNSS